MLSLVVPAYNEGARIYDNLRKISEVLSEYAEEYEIIPVNDGSIDNTADEIRRAAEQDSRIKPVIYEKNRGKGGAIKEGIANASGEIIGFLDADLDISPDHAGRFYKELLSSGADVVIGSKMHKDSQLEYPLMRKIFSWGYFVLLKVLFGLALKDTQTGVKLYKAEILKKIVPAMTVKGYAFDIEMLALAGSLGAKIREMPVKVEYTRGESFGRIRFRDIWKMFTDTLKIWKDLKISRKYDLNSL